MKHRLSSSILLIFINFIDFINSFFLTKQDQAEKEYTKARAKEQFDALVEGHKGNKADV